MMKKIWILFAAVTIFSGCEENDIEPEEPEKECTIPATILDLGGVDGCGFVFQLENGERLEPVIIFECAAPNGDRGPVDPLIDYEFVAGKKVLIEYVVLQNYASTCQTGAAARITCISEAKPSPAEQ